MSKKRSRVGHDEVEVIVASIVVLGGGISGVCCAQQVAQLYPQRQPSTFDIHLATDIYQEEDVINVLLISATQTLVESKSVFVHTPHLEEIAVYERTAEQFLWDNPGVEICIDTVVCLVETERKLVLASGKEVYFKELVIAVGVRPHLFYPIKHPRILGLRDSLSVDDFVQRLQLAKTLCIIGNGGIALELVHELTFCNIEWILKDDYVGSAFFDASASAFIMPTLNERATKVGVETKPLLHTTASSSTHTAAGAPQAIAGYGLGPEWMTKSNFKATFNKSTEGNPQPQDGYLQCHFEQTVFAFSDDQGITWHWTAEAESFFSTNPSTTKDLFLAHSMSSVTQQTTSLDDNLLVVTSQGKVIICDFIVSATGVEPNTDFLQQRPSSSPASDELRLQLTDEGYITVDQHFRTNIPGIYSVGDCCYYNPSFQFGIGHFFQMRLWTQARIMALYCAQHLSGLSDDFGTETQLEVFAHITRFFGFKVVLLGRYNAQGLGHLLEHATRTTMIAHKAKSQFTEDEENMEEYEVSNANHEILISQPELHNNNNNQMKKNNELELWIRVTPGQEYVKVVVYRGKVVGALLIGDTELEETFENLIFNALDVSRYGIRLLDPDIDINDYFD